MISFRVPASPSAALAIIAIAAVAACGKTGTANLNSVPPAIVQPAAAAAVTISGFAFHPATLKIKAGTTVTWTNHMNIDHTVTANSGGFNSGHIAPGHSFTLMFKKPGKKFPYHCMIHPFMTGTVIVTQ
jgi:plastocyanin